jgi:hypothetical protein
MGFSLFSIQGGFADKNTGEMLQYDALFVKE